MKKDINYTNIIEPSIKEARKRRGALVQINNFILDPKYINLGAGKKYLLKTYGCQGNLADSEKIAGILEMMGFTEANEELDRQAILNYYHSRGYIDATVLDIKRSITENKEENRDEMILTYIVREGEQYTYGGITISGNTIFSTEQLVDCIKLKPGMIFNQPKFNEGLTAIYDTYFESGYTYNTFDDKMHRDTEKHEVSFTLRIIENDRAHIENIIIKGNHWIFHDLTGNQTKAKQCTAHK